MFHFNLFYFRYNEIFSELVTEISSRINSPFPVVAEDIASAMYEISYLKADESLNTSCRWEKQKEKERLKDTFKKEENYKNTNYSVNKQVSKSMKNEDEIIRGKKSIFLTYEERVKLKNAIKAASKCLSVCWKICGSILNKMKKRKMKMMISLNFDGENINKNNHSNNNNSNFDEINNDDNNNNDNVDRTTNHVMNNKMDNYNMKSNQLDGNKIEFQSFETSKKKTFNQKNCEIVSALLSGMNSSLSNLKPSIAFNFNPPPLSSAKL